MDFSKDGLMQVTVDCVVFTVKNDDLKLLLIKRKYDPFKDSYALPGGFVHKEEELKEAAARELKEETGLSNVLLRQYGAYGRVNRDPRGRVVSITYLALVSPDNKLCASTDARSAEWFSVYDLPQLAFDHEEIIEYALQDLRFQIQTSNIAAGILPKEFTLTQLQTLYEQVLNRAFDKRNFRKKILDMDMLKDTGKMFREGAHRPAKLYSFVQQEHKQFSETGQILLPEARKF